MGVREDLATAASTVPGAAGGPNVKVSPYLRQTAQPYQGFVRLQAKTRDDTGLGFMDTWQVWILLPQDVAAAEKWIETNHALLIAALSPHMVVTTLTPSQLVLDSGTVPGVVIEGAREG